MLEINYNDLGIIEYKKAWDLQEKLLAQNTEIKRLNRIQELNPNTENKTVLHCKNYFLICQHPPVFTLGKSGALENLLVHNEYLKEKGISFFKTNRGGDITFHGLEQIVGYPILDLEALKPDLVWYMRNLEEIIIRTLAEYNIKSERSAGETGVWIDTHLPLKARKICAMGVRTSRWITMHGFALNVNTDLSYFDMIIPCGIANKQVTSMEKELNKKIPVNEVVEKLRFHFQDVFGVALVESKDLNI